MAGKEAWASWRASPAWSRVSVSGGLPLSSPQNRPGPSRWPDSATGLHKPHVQHGSLIGTEFCLSANSE